jgi:hypothetical protein
MILSQDLQYFFDSLERLILQEADVPLPWKHWEVSSIPKLVLYGEFIVGCYN